MTDRITSYTHDDLTFDVRDEGPLDGTPAVLLHGFPERSTSWREVAPQLHAAGIRTFAPDQRGYSPGARPRRRNGYRLPLLVGDVEALVARIGAPVHVVGHDWGAAVAWTLAGRRPDLVRTLTAVSVPHTAAFLGAMLRSSQVLRSWYMFAFQVPRLPELWMTRSPSGFDRLMASVGMTEAEVARCRHEIVEYGALPGALGWYRAIPLATPAFAGRPVTVPTTYVWGDGDHALSRTGAERTARHVRGPYRFEVLEGVNHWIPTQAADLLVPLVLDRIRSVDVA